MHTVDVGQLGCPVFYAERFRSIFANSFGDERHPDDLLQGIRVGPDAVRTETGPVHVHVVRMPGIV